MRHLSEDQLRNYRSIYLLYLDETGHSVFDERKVYNDVKSRYLTIGGLFIRGDIYWTDLHPKMLELKAKHLGDKSADLHYSDVIFSRGIFLREAFWSDFLDTIAGIDCRLISITIDKQRIQEQFKILYDPYHLILAWHIERIVFTLAKIEAQAKIIEEGKPPLRARVIIEARGSGKYDGRLENSYRLVFSRGSKIYQTVTVADIQKRMLKKDITICSKKEKRIGLQVADLVCNPLHWNTLIEFCREDVVRLMGRVERKPSVQMFWDKVGHKIARGDAGQIEGYGMKIFPKPQLL